MTQKQKTTTKKKVLHLTGQVHLGIDRKRPFITFEFGRLLFRVIAAFYKSRDYTHTMYSIDR